MRDLVARSSCGTAMSLPRQGTRLSGCALAPEVGMRMYLEGGRDRREGKEEGGERRERTALLELPVRC